MLKAILFDLDDTLYPEMNYVKSGFRVVAHYLSKYGLCEEEIYQQMLEELSINGRGKIFNKILEKNGLTQKVEVQTLVFLYRSHFPNISLPEETKRVLDELSSMSLKMGVITDGVATVQMQKILALGLKKWCEVIICTDTLGKEFWKPSCVPFLVALNLLNVEPERVAYVGDNPIKDFLGPNQLNMQSIWIVPDDKEYIFDDDNKRPTYYINELAELLSLCDRK